MFVLGNTLVGLAKALDMALWLYMYVLIGRAVCSWVSADPRNPIVQVLYRATEPPMRVIRGLLPRNLRFFPIDIAFLVLVGIVIFAQYAVVQSLYEIGLRLR